MYSFPLIIGGWGEGSVKDAHATSQSCPLPLDTLTRDIGVRNSMLAKDCVIINFCQFVGGEKNCCNTVEVIQGGNRGAVQAQRQIFTKFYMDSVAQQNGRVRYLSQDETLAIAIGNGNWEIQTKRDG